MVKAKKQGPRPPAATNHIPGSTYTRQDLCRVLRDELCMASFSDGGRVLHPQPQQLTSPGSVPSTSYDNTRHLSESLKPSCESAISDPLFEEHEDPEKSGSLPPEVTRLVKNAASTL